MSEAPVVLQRGSLRAMRQRQSFLNAEGVPAEVLRPEDCDPNG